MPFNEYPSLDGLALGELVRKREVTALELIDAAIAQIERLNPAINAVVFKAYDQARAAAREKRAGDAPFEGVPLLLKDILADCAGMPTRDGSRSVPDTPALADCELVARYKRAGFIPLAKTNVPEFGIVPTTEPVLYGPARNPWDLERTAGGSSGGSAAAVAAAMAPIAHGNDGGGSIRIPAACCGLVGLKPTRGRNSTAPIPTDVMYGYITDHVLTRSVRDSAAVLDASCGNLPGDPYTPAPVRSFLEAASTPAPKLKIAFWTRGMMGEKVHPEHEAAVQKAARLCVELGHQVEEDSPMRDFLSVAPHFLRVYTAGVAFQVEATKFLTNREPTPELTEGLTWNMYQMGKSTTAPQLMLSAAALQLFRWDFGRFFEKYDLWLTPTLGVPPVKLGTIDLQSPIASMTQEGITGLGHLNPIYNITGHPAISLPMYWSGEGLPIGILFGAKWGGEATLFQIAGQIEKACPWNKRRPPFKA